jgi:hypothetical protein
MVWEGWALYRARQEALKRGDLKEAEELRKQSEEWSRTHSTDEFVLDPHQERIDRLSERISRIEEHLGIG